MKISVIIPFYAVDDDKYKILQRCTKSLPEHFETIVVWNRKEGYAPSINNGVKCASGDYFLIMNDDVFWKSGDLEDLCIPGVVTSPLYDGRSYKDIWGSCFCVPRTVWEEIGGMSEEYDISYYDDDDLIKRLETNGTEMKSIKTVDFDHPEPGRTLEKMPDRDSFFEKNKQVFEEKWN